MLTRSLPLLIALIVLAVAIYAFVSWRRTPTRAKEVLIKVFLVLCSAIAAFFALASLYAVVDGNTPVLELAASCAIVGVVGLLVTLVCRHFFKKHHPHYAYEPTEKARPITNKPDALSIITKVLNYLNDHRRR